MFREEDEKNDDKIYSLYYAEIDNADVDTVDNSDIDNDEVDRLYSQVYHEACNKTDASLVSEDTQPKQKNTNISCLSPNTDGVTEVHSVSSSFTDLKHAGISDSINYNNVKNGAHVVFDKQQSMNASADVLTKDVFLDHSVFRVSERGKDFKSKQSKISKSDPDIRSMLFADFADSDSDQVEVVYNSKDKDCSSVKCSTTKTITFTKSEKDASLSKENDCIILSSDSSDNDDDVDVNKNVKPNINTMNPKEKFIGNSIRESTSSDFNYIHGSDSDSLSDEKSDKNSSHVVIDSDSTSTSSTLSSSELSDSTSTCSYSEFLGNLDTDIKFNVKTSQTHFIEDISDYNKKSDTDLWNICDKDRFGRKTLNGRYYQPLAVRCQRCNIVGHLSKNCPKKKTVRCILCGRGGHYHWKCPNALCHNCNIPGHSAKNCTRQQRRWHDHCSRCGMKGHHFDTCSDIWRQYHITTTGDLKVPDKKVKPNPRVFCYNCARPNHYGYECNLERQDKYSTPSYPFIAHYGEFSKSDNKKEFRNKNNFSPKNKVDYKSTSNDFPRSSSTSDLPVFINKRKLDPKSTKNCHPLKKFKTVQNHYSEGIENFNKMFKNNEKRNCLNTVIGDFDENSNISKKRKKKKKSEPTKEENTGQKTMKYGEHKEFRNKIISPVNKKQNKKNSRNDFLRSSSVSDLPAFINKRKVNEKDIENSSPRKKLKTDKIHFSKGIENFSKMFKKDETSQKKATDGLNSVTVRENKNRKNKKRRKTKKVGAEAVKKNTFQKTEKYKELKEKKERDLKRKKEMNIKPGKKKRRNKESKINGGIIQPPKTDYKKHTKSNIPVVKMKNSEVKPVISQRGFVASRETVNRLMS